MYLNGLPADMVQFVHDALASGKYQSAEELVCEALQVLREQDAHREAQPPSDEAHSDSPPQSAEAYVHAIAKALSTGEFGLARQLALEGIERYPTHEELHKCAHVLAPPTSRVVPASSTSRASIKANNAWLKAHWQDYRGQWIAVRDGQLVYATSSFDDLVAHIGDSHGVLLTKIHA